MGSQCDTRAASSGENSEAVPQPAPPQPATPQQAAASLKATAPQQTAPQAASPAAGGQVGAARAAPADAPVGFSLAAGLRDPIPEFCTVGKGRAMWCNMFIHLGSSGHVWTWWEKEWWVLHGPNPKYNKWARKHHHWQRHSETQEIDPPSIQT